MDLTNKIQTLLLEATLTPSDKKQIADFVSWMKKSKIKVLSAKNFNQILDKYGKLDTDFLMSFWNNVKTELEKEKIKVESRMVDGQLLTEAAKLTPKVAYLGDAKLDRNEIALIVSIFNKIGKGSFVATQEHYGAITTEDAIELSQKYLRAPKASKKGKEIANNVLGKLTDIVHAKYMYVTNKKMLNSIDNKPVGSGYKMDFDYMSGTYYVNTDKTLSDGQELYIVATPFWEDMDYIQFQALNEHDYPVYGRDIKFPITWDVSTDSKNYLKIIKKEISLMEKKLKSTGQM